jgi:hypothetical protein
MLITLDNPKYTSHCMFSKQGRGINESKFLFKLKDSMMGKKGKRKLKHLKKFTLSSKAVIKLLINIREVLLTD